MTFHINKGFKWGSKSAAILKEIHPELVDVFLCAINHIDYSLIDGSRGEAEQEHLFNTGMSKAHYGESKHNPSHPLISGGKVWAVDAVPYPSMWNDTELMADCAYFVLGLAHAKGVQLLWGGDWNFNGKYSDENFFDAAHFELIG